MSQPRFLNGSGEAPRNPVEFAFLEPDVLDDTIIKLPCYEPSGLKIEVTARQALRHLLITGSSGSGKSTIINRLFHDLIGYKTKTGQSIGLLILDAQGDGTVERVRQIAAEVGRPDDVRVLSPQEGYLDPLGDLNSFADLDRVVSKLLCATETAHDKGSNAFWSENTRLLIESALAVLLVTDKSISLHQTLCFISELLVQGQHWSADVEARVERFRSSLVKTSDHLSPGISAKLQLVDSSLKGWKALDSRTRGILQSCVAVVVAPFLSANSLIYWDEAKGDQVRPAEALDGKIIVVSVKGSTEPETAALISRLVKIDFYRAAQERISPCDSPLTGCILDELPLAVTVGSSRWSDVSNLATLRGKGVFVIAATQGLSNLDLVIGPEKTKALLVNFSNLIFLHSQETGYHYHFADKILGIKPAPPRAASFLSDVGNLLHLQTLGTASSGEQVCPPGALSRLEAHQAYVALADGFRSLDPVWLAPLYFPQKTTPIKISPDLDLAALRSAPCLTVNQSEVPLAKLLALRLWHILRERPRQVRAAKTTTLKDFKTKMRRHSRLRTGKDLETIPASWRLACINLTRKLPKGVHLAALSFVAGVLDPEFVAFEVLPGGVEDLQRLTRRWQLSVYPSILRSPNATDRRWLKLHFPHLCPRTNPKSLNKQIDQENP